ncbi:MAG TPA: RNA-guided pseudouridylation complex pseudouridine synthase subunit Cbf5 [Candidatus Thermoplasmatota archaeon]|nr:RNA-guided pseudouridylation complex pseudouridine synthase subunit Cbf5 [Candidatus Thermoplasmatota archaeon]
MQAPPAAPTERRMLERAKAETDPAHGKAPHARSIEEHLRLGAVNLDKPAGPTSHQVVAWLKLALGLAKAGHGGTLDPNVTGVLPVALSDATRVIRVLLEAPKEYVCVMETHEPVGAERLKKGLLEFRGPIYQTPPLKSAVKKQLRVRTIYDLKVMEAEDRRALYWVSCEAGTYIRKLCHDVGLVLGTTAHMRDLRRVKTGAFREHTSVTLHDLRDAFEFHKESGDETWLRRHVRPVEDLVAHLPRVVARDSAVDALCHGASLAVPGVVAVEETLKRNELAAVFTLKGELVSVGPAQRDAGDIVKGDSGIAVKTDRVVMDPGTYPRGWSTKKSD